jgi:hypothetical protein
MKIIVNTVVAVILCLSMTISFCSGVATMTNDDVIKLVRAGMAEALIISAIDGSDPLFDTSADALIKLKAAGVSDAIINKIIIKKLAPAVQSLQTAKDAACRLATSENLQAVIDGDKQINLSYRQADIDEDISAGSTIASFFTLGVAPEKGTVSARISGGSASNRVKSKIPVFPDLATFEGQSTDDVFVLVKLEVKGDDRILIIGESSASLFGGYKGRAKFRDGTKMPLKLEKVQSNCTYKGEVMNIYRGVPSTPLAPGEYALLYGERFFDFGVDP